MVLNTRRLLLRQEFISDAEVIFKELGCNPVITKYTGWNPYVSLEATKEKIVRDIAELEKGTGYSWVIVYGDQLIGTIGAYDYNEVDCSIEIGYSIFEEFWGNGFATEAVDAVVHFLMETGIRRIHAWTHIHNVASSKVLEHAGFTFVREDGQHKIYEIMKWEVDYDLYSKTN